MTRRMTRWPRRAQNPSRSPLFRRYSVIMKRDQPARHYMPGPTAMNSSRELVGDLQERLKIYTGRCWKIAVAQFGESRVYCGQPEPLLLQPDFVTLMPALEAAFSASGVLLG